MIEVDGAGNVFIADTDNNRIQKFTADGKFISSIMSWGDGSDKLRFPYGLTTDAAGNLYVADTGNSRIVKFAPKKK